MILLVNYYLLVFDLALTYENDAQKLTLQRNSFFQISQSILKQEKTSEKWYCFDGTRPIFQPSDWSSDTVANTAVSLDQSEAWKIGLRTIKTISFLAGFILGEYVYQFWSINSKNCEIYEHLIENFETGVWSISAGTL